MMRVIKASRSHRPAKARYSVIAAETRKGFASKQLLFDLRQNAFHLFFAERAHGLGPNASQ